MNGLLNVTVLVNTVCKKLKWMNMMKGHNTTAALAIYHKPSGQTLLMCWHSITPFQSQVSIHTLFIY